MFIGVVPHKGDLVPEPVVALRTRVGRGAGEQGSEHLGIMGEEVILEGKFTLAVAAGGTLNIYSGVLRDF